MSIRLADPGILLSKTVTLLWNNWVIYPLVSRLLPPKHLTNHYHSSLLGQPHYTNGFKSKFIMKLIDFFALATVPYTDYFVIYHWWEHTQTAYITPQNITNLTRKETYVQWMIGGPQSGPSGCWLTESSNFLTRLTTQFISGTLHSGHSEKKSCMVSHD